MDVLRWRGAHLADERGGVERRQGSEAQRSDAKWRGRGLGQRNINFYFREAKKSSILHQSSSQIVFCPNFTPLLPNITE